MSKSKRKSGIAKISGDKEDAVQSKKNKKKAKKSNKKGGRKGGR